MSQNVQSSSPGTEFYNFKQLLNSVVQNLFFQLTIQEIFLLFIQMTGT